MITENPHFSPENNNEMSFKEAVQILETNPSLYETLSKHCTSSHYYEVRDDISYLDDQDIVTILADDKHMRKAARIFMDTKILEEYPEDQSDYPKKIAWLLVQELDNRLDHAKKNTAPN